MSASLNLDWQVPDKLIAAFHDAHDARYGHRFDLPVELVNLRLHLAGATPDITLPEIAAGESVPEAAETAPVHGVDAPVPVHDRETLRADQCFDGPAIVREAVTTTWIAPGWSVQVDPVGNLLLER